MMPLYSGVATIFPIQSRLTIENHKSSGKVLDNIAKIMPINSVSPSCQGDGARGGDGGAAGGALGGVEGETAPPIAEENRETKAIKRTYRKAIVPRW